VTENGHNFHNQQDRFVTPLTSSSLWLMCHL